MRYIMLAASIMFDCKVILFAACDETILSETNHIL